MLSAVAGTLQRASPLVPRIATGLGAGLARTSGPCGAFVGGVLAIGLVLGRDVAGEPLDPCFAAVQALRAALVDRFGSVDCATLTGCDLADPAGRERFRAEGIRQRCLLVTAAAAGLAAEIAARHET